MIQPFLLLFLAQGPNFSADVKLVNLLATVTDRDGRIVRDLKREDFALSEDGRPQHIRHFSEETGLPLKIGVLVDTSCSQPRVLEPERKASYAFLDDMLRPESDQAFVLHFDSRIDLLQAFTSSREKLAAAFAELHMPRRCRTFLFDAVKQASEEIMRPEQGRKALIILSDGGDTRSEASIGTAIEYAQRADTIIYSIFFAQSPITIHPAVIASHQIYLARGHKVMHRLAQETGGGYFEVSNSLSIDQIYSIIEDELRHQYTIAYSSDRPASDGKYRKIKLMANRKDLTVRTRDGYYPK
jgi:VWFA-related protein